MYHNHNENNINNISIQNKTANKSELGRISNKIRSLASSPTDHFYSELSDKVKNINPDSGFLSMNLGQISTKLKQRLRKKRYSRNRLNYKSKKRKEQIENVIEKINNFKFRGGSKKGPKVKGKRVLKNGTMAGYVRQKDGSYKWQFLKTPFRKRG